jgi:TonB family protein
MRQPLSSLTLSLAAVAACFFAALENAPAQDATGSTVPQAGVVLTKLSEPVYPRLARQAHIGADVKVVIGIRQDGSVASAELFSGHPMLAQAALDSARKSTFECRGCGEAVTSYPMTYTFEVKGDCHFGPNCESEEPRAPEVTQSQHQVTITVEPACTCDPSSTRIKVRSAKCFYLWKCSFRDAADK